MYFVLSKAIGWFTVPSNVLGLVVVVGVALSMVRPVRWTRALAALGLAALVLAGASPLGAWLIRPLEDRFPVWHDDGREVAGIVVLGGTVNARISLARDQLTFGEGERIMAAADLARRYPAARIVFSGGSGDVLESPPEAHAVHRFASTLGLDVSRMSFDDASRNTVENASFVAALVGVPLKGRWLLVTSAFHMPRAQALFRKAGLNLDAYPVAFRTAGARGHNRWSWSWSWSWLSGLDMVDLATKEWVGLLAARLFGHSDVLFPAPSPAQPAPVARGVSPSRAIVWSNLLTTIC